MTPNDPVQRPAQRVRCNRRLGGASRPEHEDFAPATRRLYRRGTSHNLTVLSSLTDASVLPSGENATELILPV